MLSIKHKEFKVFYRKRKAKTFISSIGCKAVNKKHAKQIAYFELFHIYLFKANDLELSVFKVSKS